ncbi:MAG: hypothetical protein AMXMBFR82_38300 [Candidatus Hydrogenedentota bacterium]
MLGRVLPMPVGPDLLWSRPASALACALGQQNVLMLYSVYRKLVTREESREYPANPPGRVESNV